MKIRYKLFLAILLTAFVSVFALQQAQRYSFESGLKRYSQSSRLERLEPLVLGLTDIYEKEKSWESLRGQDRLPIPEILVRSDERFNRPPPPHRSNRPGERRELGRSPRVYAGLALLDKNKQYLAGAVETSDSITKTITYNDVVIGYLAVPSDSMMNSHIDRRFSDQQKVGRIWAVVVVLIGALLSALLISRSLGKPIKHLVERVQKLSDGHYGVTFISEKSDEFGSLSNNLNSLAATLRDDRTNRRQWI